LITRQIVFDSPISEKRAYRPCLQYVLRDIIVEEMPSAEYGMQYMLCVES